MDAFGNKKTVYSWKLTASDPLSKGLAKLNTIKRL